MTDTVCNPRAAYHFSVRPLSLSAVLRPLSPPQTPPDRPVPPVPSVCRSDGVCRVFSAAPERQAAPDVQEVYEQEVAGTQLSKADLGGYKVRAAGAALGRRW